jgi:hypothetical protein
MEAPKDLRDLAKNRQQLIAVRWLKVRRPRIDAISLLLDALWLFRGKSL